jgi:hypothetical protein
MLLINILLLVAGFASAIVAFGGDTWVKEKKPLIERITARGWVSILAMVIALALGAYKETLTKRKDDTKDAENKLRETELKGDRARLQLKLDDETTRLKILQSQVTTAEDELTHANQALAQNRKVVGSIAGLEKQIQGQVDVANQQISVANQNLDKSGQVLSAIGGLQTQIHDVALLTALTKRQSELDIEVNIPIRPIRFPGVSVPTTLIDLVFPKWREDGIQDPEEALLGFEIESASRLRGLGLNGNLWGFRKDPYNIVTLGMADIDERLAATRTEMKMYGSARLGGTIDQAALVSSFRFPESQVPGQWLSEFRTGTKFFSVKFTVRKDLDTSEKQRLIDFWNKMFSETGSFIIPLLDQDNFFMEYKLKRNGTASLKEGPLSILSITYSIASPPTFHTRDL